MPSSKPGKKKKRTPIQGRKRKTRKPGSKNQVKSGVGSGNGRFDYSKAFKDLMAAARQCHQDGLESFTRSDLIDRMEYLWLPRTRLQSDPLLTTYLYRCLETGALEQVRVTGGRGNSFRLVEEYLLPGLDEGFAHELDWLRWFYNHCGLSSLELQKLRLQYMQETGFRLDSFPSEI